MLVKYIFGLGSKFSLHQTAVKKLLEICFADKPRTGHY